MFDIDFLAYSKQIKLCPRDHIIPIKQEDICDYNTLCFMSSGFMLDEIIINSFSDIKNKKNVFSEKIFIFQNQE